MKVPFGVIAIIVLLLSGCTSQPQSQYSQKLIANERDVAAEQAEKEDDDSAGVRTFSRTCHAANSYTRAERWFTYVAMGLADFFVPSYNGNDSDLPEPIGDNWDNNPLKPDIVCED
ncbi:hypothetical protein [Phytohalomonas tamaricis]|uniref:hypothetical protein n=1 Tax=Phytohalomonas tamaricis TaxID=2081032 RepID=UPI000D0B17C7|nr:hypothetical protein [Phytohalomonas tamaricis]